MGDLMAFLKIEKLSKSFGGLQAVSNLDVVVNRGEILGVIGPNGSGKTTLFNLISGLIKPDNGKITLDSKEITGLSPHRVCESGIARTFQIVKPFKEMTVLKNVMVGRAYGSRPLKNMKQINFEAEELLRFTGLKSKQSIVAEKLSLIDRKRLELTRALATQPKILLLDEVMAGLNPAEIEEAVDLVLQIRASGVTVMIVEHVMRVVLGLSDRVLVLHVGEKIADGTPEEIANDEHVIRVYLGEQ